MFFFSRLSGIVGVFVFVCVCLCVCVFHVTFFDVFSPAFLGLFLNLLCVTLFCVPFLHLRTPYGRLRDQPARVLLGWGFCQQVISDGAFPSWCAVKYVARC